jgi:hypothetical protein
MKSTVQSIRITASLLVLFLSATYTTYAEDRDSCLRFVETKRLPECYHGAFTCLGEVNENCHIAEHQLHMTISTGLDDSNHHHYKDNVVKIKFENEGLFDSAIETIWIEDEYNLLDGFIRRNSIQTSKNINNQIEYKHLSNDTFFDDAYANFIPFDQHFVVGCHSAGQGNLRRHTLDNEGGCVKNVFTPPPIKNYKEIDIKDREKFEFENDKSAYILKKEYQEERQYVTLNFETECSVKDIRKAVRLGLIRIGTKMGGFATRPNHKSLLSCPDVIHIEEYDEDNAYKVHEEDNEEY